MRLLPLFFSAIWLVNLGCKSDGPCENNQDCPAGQECADGTCQLKMPPPCVGLCGGAQDIGVRMDAEPIDASPDSGRDGGDAGDGGRPDAGDAGDAGDGGDGGDMDGGDAGDTGPIAVAPAGEVWIKETTDFVTDVDAFAEFLDRSTATYDFETQEYAATNANCVLIRLMVVAGAPTGIEADSVNVDVDNGNSYTYASVGMGRYEPLVAITPPVFDFGTMVDFEIVSTGVNGTLAGATAATPAPTGVMQPNPQPGSPIFLAQGITLTWAGAGTPPPARLTYIELYDSDREIRILCRTIGDPGTFTMPTVAITDFMALNPTTPITLELRYEFVATVPVQIVGGPVLPIGFHATKGVRWPVN